MNILLIGPRAAGKSTIGPAFAKRRRQPFVELDEMALTLTGLPSVKEVWAQQGESAWRAAEAECFREAMRGDGQVIALGGGAPMIDSVRKLIEENRANRRALVVYLSCGVAELQRRLCMQKGRAGAIGDDRPTLTGLNPIEEVPIVLKQRMGTYESLADLVCVTTGRMPEEVAEHIATGISALTP